jgi:hypothetical protein
MESEKPLVKILKKPSNYVLNNKQNSRLNLQKMELINKQVNFKDATRSSNKPKRGKSKKNLEKILSY